MYVVQECGRKFFDIFCLRFCRRFTFCWLFRYKKVINNALFFVDLRKKYYLCVVFVKIPFYAFLCTIVTLN